MARTGRPVRRLQYYRQEMISGVEAIGVMRIGQVLDKF